MRKIGKLLPGLVILAFLLFSAAAYASGLGAHPAAPARVQTRSADSSEPVRRQSVPGGRINVNTADLDTLKTLPGIGEVRAARIIEYRDAHGPFRHTGDLLAVEGIGPGILESIRDLICLEDEYENLDH